MNSKLLSKAVATAMVIAMAATAVFVPGIFDSDYVYASEKIVAEEPAPVDSTVPVVDTEPLKFKVKFNANKGKFKKGSIKSKTVTNGKTYGKLATVKKREGYKFMGWYSPKVNGKKITKKTTVNLSADTTLYAQWKYSIKFNANSGKVSKGSKKVTSGKKYGSLPKPKRSGYDFLGWYTKKKGGSEITAASYVAKAKKHTLYAQWSKKGTDKYPGYFTKAKYKKIKNGMTYDEVVKIVGGKEDYVLSITIGGRIYQRTSRWNVANKSPVYDEQVTIIFSSGWIVTNKSNPFGW